jgi:hypothetical protein
MTTASQRTVQALEQIVKPVPLGTNLALLQLMWAIISGAFLTARGAIHTALQESGFSRPEIQRCWCALWAGQWHIYELIRQFRELVLADAQWQARLCDGWRPVAVDLTAIWRPKLEKWPGKMFNRLADKKKTGIGFGLIADIGAIGEQRVPLLRAIVRGETAGESETTLQRRTLRQVAKILQEDEVSIHDAGVSLKEVHEAGIPRFLVRQRNNITARRNELPAYCGRGCHPKFGALVRPLARRHKEKEIAASQPDCEATFRYQERLIKAKGWHDLVRRDLHVSAANETFSIWVIEDPAYDRPWVLATNLACSAETAYHLYLNRWPVEQIPLVAKQLLGMHRQFVFAHQSCWRLGELAFFTGNVLAWLAAILPPIASGFWDRNPKRTPGRLRRRLSRSVFSNEWLSQPELRKKKSVTTHLPKGIDAHRRRKAPT